METGRKQVDYEVGNKKPPMHSRWKKGQSGNLNGRPSGTSLKEYARKWYEKMTPEEKEDYLQRVEKKKPGFAWTMAEGNPQNQTDITSDGKAIFDPETKAKTDQALDSYLNEKS